MPLILWMIYWISIKILGLVGLEHNIKIDHQSLPSRQWLLRKGQFWDMLNLYVPRKHFTLIPVQWKLTMIYGSTIRYLKYSMVYLILRYFQDQFFYLVSETLSNCHVWGCPIYVLEPKLQKLGVNISKWDPSSWRGVNICFGKMH